MTDFQSFRNAVLENDDLQDEVMSVVMMATANGSGLFALRAGIRLVAKLMAWRFVETQRAIVHERLRIKG